MVAFERATGFPTPRRRPRTGREQSLADVLAGRVATGPAPGATTGGETPPSAPEPPATARTTAAPTSPAPTTAAPTSPALSFDEAMLSTMLAATAARARGALLEELEGSREAQLAAAATAIVDATAELRTTRAVAAREDAAVILAMVEAIARHVIPHALAHCPLADLEAALPELLDRLQGQSELVVAAHADLVEPLRARLAGAGDGGEPCRVVVDASLAPGAAIVRWQDGEARHLPDERITAALELCAGWLAESASPPPITADEQTDEQPDEQDDPDER